MTSKSIHSFLCILLFSLRLYAQASYNGTPAGIVLLNPAAASDITASVQAAITASVGGVVFIPPGSFVLSGSGLNVTGGVQLICSGLGGLTGSGTKLTYTGSGVAITVSSGMLAGCEVTKTVQGAVGVQMNSGVVQFNYIHNFATCLMMHGDEGFAYFGTVYWNFLDTCTAGLDMHNSGGNTVNNNLISTNIVQHSNVSYHDCTFCVGNTWVNNDAEFPVGANPVEYKIEGPGQDMSGNWSEWNSSKAWTGTAIGLQVTSVGNSIKGQKMPQSDASVAGWQNKSIVAGNSVDIPYDNTSGSIVPDIRLPGAVKIENFIQATSSAPAVDNTLCTGATIGAGATNLAGTITGLPAATCTVVLTFASATATTGWSCGVSDQTTANLFRKTASTTTTITFSGTSLLNDVLSYGPCVAY